MSLLKINNLQVKAGDFEIEDITFSVNPHDYYIILGPTGSGKTILLETICGIRQAYKGHIYLQGEDITYLPPEKRLFGFAYQDSLLYPFLNVYDNIMFGAKIQGVDKKPDIIERLYYLAENMDIKHLLTRTPYYLSGGEKQRVSLARALLLKPKILLLDEPVNALDPQTKRKVLSLLKKIYRQENFAILHVTHDVEESMSLGNNMLVLNKGKAVFQGLPQEIYDAPSTTWLANFMGYYNIIEGFLKDRDNESWFISKEGVWEIGPLNIKSEAQQISLLISPDNLGIYEQPNQAGLFFWKGAIISLNSFGFYIEVMVKGSLEWRILLTRKEYEKSNLFIGKEVFLGIQQQDVKFC
jgi:molybdate transport system ATP-binding protein